MSDPANSTARIWRALLWKEWREQRAIVPAGLAIAALIPMIIYTVGRSTATRFWVVEVAEVVPFLVAVVVWPMFAAVAGAAISAEGTGGDSLGFLLSRPVSRSRVWVSKVVTGLVALILIVGGSFLFAQLFHFALLGSWFRFPFASVSFNGYATDAVRTAVVGVVPLAFAATLACGTLVRQQVTAVTAGILIAGIGVGAALGAQGWLSASPRAAAVEGATLLVGSFLGITAAAVFVASHFLYRRGVMLRGSEWLRPLLVGGMATLIVASLGLVAAAGAATRINPDTARVRVRAVIAESDALLLSVSGTRFAGTSYWMHPLGGAPRPLTDRMAERADMVPGGEQIVYATRMGFLGLRRDDCQLRAVRTDGRDDRVLLEHVVCGGIRVFSDDGSRVAVWSLSSLPNRDRLFVASIDGAASPEPIVDFHGTPAEGARPVGWVRDSAKLVLVARRALFLVDADSGAIREIFAPVDASGVRVEASSSSHLVAQSHTSTYDGQGEDHRSYRLDIVDLVTGDAQRMLGACASTAAAVFSPDGGRLFYSGCPNTRESASELRVRDLRTGADRRVARFQGELGMQQVSPAGTRLAATERWPRHRRSPRSRTVFFDLTGTGDGFARVGAFGPLPREGWRFSAWLDDARIIVSRRTGRTQIGVLNLDTGGLDIVVGGR